MIKTCTCGKVILPHWKWCNDCNARIKSLDVTPMSNRADTILKLKEEHKTRTSVLVKRIDALIRERNHLEKNIRIRDHVIDGYQQWFRAHEHIIQSEKVGITEPAT